MFRSIVVFIFSISVLASCGSSPKAPVKVYPSTVKSQQPLDYRAKTVAKACQKNPSYTGPVYTSSNCASTCLSPVGGSLGARGGRCASVRSSCRYSVGGSPGSLGLGAYVTSYCQKGLPVAALPDLPCPGLGNQQCKSNWDEIKTGLSEDQVVALLGSPKRKSSYKNQYDGGYVNFGKEGVTGWSKPSNYVFILPPVEVRVTPATQQKLSKCPRLGIHSCKANWDMIRQELPKLTVEAVLGKPPEIKSVSVSSNRLTETWVFPKNGVVKFINGIVSEYKIPQNFEYYGPLRGVDSQPVGSGGESNDIVS